MPQFFLNSFITTPSAPPMIDTTDLMLWFKGYEGMLIGGIPPVDGGTIDQLENQAGTTDALQTTAGARPTWHANVINGKGVIRFDGTDDFLSLANNADVDIVNPLTLFFVIYIPAFTSFSMLITKGSSGATQQYSTYINPAPFAGRITYCTTSCQAQDGVAAASWERVIIRCDTGSSNLRIYRNGAQLGSAGSLPTNSTSATTGFIGKRIDGLFNAFDFVEMGVFNRNLSDQEIVDLDAYLAGVIGA